MTSQISFFSRISLMVILACGASFSMTGCSDDKAAVAPEKFAPKASLDTLQSNGGGDSSKKKGPAPGAEKAPTE